MGFSKARVMVRWQPQEYRGDFPLLRKRLFPFLSTGIPLHRSHVGGDIKGVLHYCILLTASSEQVKTWDNAGCVYSNSHVKQLIIQTQDVRQMCCSKQREHFIDLLSVKPAANEGLWFSLWLLIAKIRCSTVCMHTGTVNFDRLSVRWCLCAVLEVWYATIWLASDLEWV